MGMTRRRFLGTAAATAGVAAIQSCGGGSAAPPPAAMDGVDVTAAWRAVQADPKAAPPAEYKAGHVAPRELAPDVLRKRADGFEIALPGNFPIPTPAVCQGRLVASGGFGSKQVYCFDARSGAFQWGVDLDDDGPSTPAVEDGLAVVNTESCTIFTLELATGKPVWSWWLGDPLMAAPTIAGGRVFASWPCPAAQGRHAEASHLLGAFDLKTGKILWQRWIDGDVISAPVASGEEVVAASFTGTVFRFRQATGELLSALKARATSAPVVVGNELHFSRRSEASGGACESLGVWDQERGRMAQYAGKRALYLDDGVQERAALGVQAKKLDAGNGFSAGAPETAKAFSAKANVGQASVASLQSFQGSRVLNLGGANYSCMGDEILKTDPRTGKTVWSSKLAGDLAKEGGFLGTPPIAAGTTLLVATLGGELLRLDPATGAVARRQAIGAPVRFAPVADGGRVYVGTQDGKLVCLETGDGSITGWPQWGANAQRTGAPRAAGGR